MARQNYGAEIQNDLGPLIMHPEVFRDQDPILDHREDKVTFREAWRIRQERLVEDFIRHPFRDGIAAALTLGGLGVAVGVATTSKRR